MGAKAKALTWAIAERRTEVARLLRKGWTERRIADELGLTKSTVHNDVEAIATELVESRIADADKARALMTDRLVVAEIAVLATLESAEQQDPELVLKATDRLIRLHERLSKMYGTDAPEKLDATVTEGPSPHEAARLVREVFAVSSTAGGEEKRVGSEEPVSVRDSGDADAADDPSD